MTIEYPSTQGQESSVAPAPLISIVTPSYNQGRFIRATVASVLGQDYAHVEYWVIDGGSSDETLAVLRTFEGDPRFHWVSEPDRGQSAAINKGLARATGDLFAWLNSDDLLAPGALRRVAGAWRAHEPALIYGTARFIDELGHDLGAMPGQRPDMSLDKLLRPARYGLPQQATFAPTTLVRELGGIDESLHFAMDLDLWVRLGQRLPFRYVPFGLGLFRLHNTSKTTALATQFTRDVERITARAARQGLLTARQAQVQLDLFTAMVYLTAQPRSLSAATSHLIRAVLLERAILPEAALLLSKGLVRRILGENLWSALRRRRPLLTP